MTARETIRVHGPDAATYLQGQISQDVDALAQGSTVWSLLLQPNGRISSWFRLHRVDGDDFLLDVDEGHGAGLVARLERFKLRTDATIEPVDLAIDEPLAWPGLVDSENEEQRIRAGMPRLGRELTEDTIPGEGGAHFIDCSVSFTKGCYTGQELVARIDSRGGNVPRPIRVLRAEAPLEVGATVRVAGEAVGAVTSAAGLHGLAPVMRRVEIGDRVDVDGTTAELIEPAGN